jgi:hypothetical protein
MTNERDGFDDDDTESTDGVIRGRVLKFLEGQWSVSDGSPAPDGPLLAIDVGRALQRWQGKQRIDTIRKIDGEPYPKVSELNSAIPEEEWDLDLNGEPKPPWSDNHIVYFADQFTGAVFTAIASTAGQAIACRFLREETKLLRKIARQTDFANRAPRLGVNENEVRGQEAPELPNRW